MNSMDSSSIEFPEDIARAQTAIVNMIFGKSAAASAFVPLGLQAPLAALLLLLAAVLSVFYFTASNLKCAVFYASGASLAVSFGAIFLIDAVRVYTG